MYKILVVDDEAKIREMIKKYAIFDGYQVDEAADGLDAIEMVKTHDYNCVILDIMMPALDGFSTCKEIRKIKKVPVIMLSARGEEYDRIHGFEMGIDDYVVKPFSPRELMMRVRVVVSRNNGDLIRDANHDIFQRDGLKIDFTSRKVTVDQQDVDMTPKEYDLLFFLVRNRGIALTRERLITEVWGYDYFGDDRTLDTHVKLLRSNLGPYRSLLVTLRGVGYRFEA